MTRTLVDHRKHNQGGCSGRAPGEPRRAACGFTDRTGGPVPAPAPPRPRPRPGPAPSGFRQKHPPVAAVGLALPAGGSGPAAPAGRGEWARGGPSARSRGWRGTRAGLRAGSRLGAARRGRGAAGVLLLSGLGIAVVEGHGLRARSPRRDPGGHHADRALQLERSHPAVGWLSGVGGRHVDKQGNVR